MFHSNRLRYGFSGLLAQTALLVIASGMAAEHVDAAGTLYWSTGYIRRASTDGACIQTIYPSPGNGAHELDIDLESGKVYYTHFHAEIRRSDLDGSNIELLYTSTFAVPLGIDVDPIHRKLYWTEYGNHPSQNRIMCGDMDGSNVEQLFSGFRVPHGIATDPAGGKVYWTEGLFDTVNSGSIHRANLDGTGHEQIVDVAGQVPIGIAVHRASAKVYWTDGMSGDERFGGIYRANLDGSDIEQVLLGPQGLRYIDIDEVSGKLYFGREVTPADVYRCDLDGGKFEALGVGSAYGVAVVSEEFGFVCPGDVNGDLHVNGDDLLRVINSWGPCPSCAADFNGDGVVDVADLLFVINHWVP